VVLRVHFTICRRLHLQCARRGKSTVAGRRLMSEYNYTVRVGRLRDAAAAAAAVVLVIIITVDVIITAVCFLPARSGDGRREKIGTPALNNLLADCRSPQPVVRDCSHFTHLCMVGTCPALVVLDECDLLRSRCEPGCVMNVFLPTSVADAVASASSRRTAWESGRKRKGNEEQMTGKLRRIYE